MRSAPCLLFWAILCFTGGVPSLRAGSWEDANTAFAAGDYAKALPLYQEIITREGPTAARLYNLGNTLAKLDQPGPAVLCYEQAALLAPRDADLQANLKLTRPASAASLVEPPPLWKAPLYWISLHEWSWLACLGILFTALPLTAWLFLTKRPVWLREAAPWCLGGGAALTVLSTLALFHRRAETNLAILTAREPVLRLSPFVTADPITASPPPSGTRVLPGARHDGWVHVSLPGSSTSGWVQADEVARIVPGK